MQKRPSVEAIFGKVLRQMREERGLTQEKMAELAEIDRTYIYRLENGLRSPSLDVIFRVADALDVSPAAILERVNDLR